MGHQPSIHCILPPPMLENIARHGDESQRARAIDTLAKDQSLRALRARNAALVTLAPRPERIALTDGGAPIRTIFDCGGRESLSRAKIVRGEEQGPTGDIAVDEAYDGLGATFDLFWDQYERDSIDDHGLQLKGYVHYGEAYGNAFWDGLQMVFGDGDGQLFNRFTVAVDVIGHELAHGVTEYETGLEYFRQSGALNESLSDVFGSLVRQRQLDQRADEADWLIGAGLLVAEGMALRSMKAPGQAYDHPVLGKDPQPAHMRDYVETAADNGGVHINSGIPNHAFYVAAMQIGGYAWERAGRIWYEAMRDPRVRPSTQFRSFARTTARVAGKLYGDGSVEHKAVMAAWDEVGVNV